MILKRVFTPRDPPEECQRPRGSPDPTVRPPLWDPQTCVSGAWVCPVRIPWLCLLGNLLTNTGATNQELLCKLILETLLGESQG